MFEAELALAQVHLERTLRLAIALGATATECKVGCYIRRLSTCYRPAKEHEGKVGAIGVMAEPWGRLAHWHHEAARALMDFQE